MSDLVVTKPSGLVPNKYATQEVANEIDSSSAFLPYVSLMHGTSKLVKEGKATLGNFCLIKGKEPIDLARDFDCLCLGWRPRAMSYGEDTISVYNPESPEFQKIKKAADAGTKSNSYGLEFLIYIIEEDVLSLFFFGSKTGRIESPNMLAIFEKQLTIDEYVVACVKSNLTGKKESYFVPMVSESENTVTKLPNPDALTKAQESFNNPVETTVETVEEDVKER